MSFTPGQMHRGTATLEKLSRWRSPTTQLGALAAFLLAFLAVAVTGLIRRPRIKGRLLLAGTAFVNLVFVVGIAYTVSSTIGADPMLGIHGIPSAVATLLVLPFVSSALLVGALVRVGLGWPGATRTARTYAVVSGLMLAAFIGYLYAWNLLGWHP